ncbi:MAG: hypothetical protein EHM88_04725 [Candidatus Rokuibacteriota bacterium]|nr:MAG: hypothetical protein EHM88_04725 [Candidatus Rokubacteria bacterium]
MALGHTAIVRGRAGEAMQVLAPALEIIEARGIPTWFPWAAALHGYALALSGRADEARDLLTRALERAVALPFLFGHAQWVAWLAHAHLLGGRLDEARRRGDEALRLARQRGTRGYEAWALYVLAEVEARRSVAEAESFARQARALAETLGMRPLVERCAAVLDRLRLGSGADPSPEPPTPRAAPAEP